MARREHCAKEINELNSCPKDCPSTPMNALPQVAFRIEDYFDVHAQDLEDDSEVEGECHETDQDRAFLDDAPVHDEYTHRLGFHDLEDRDAAEWAARIERDSAAYERAVAHEKAGDVYRPEDDVQGLHLPVLDVIPNTWVRSPADVPECEVAFVISPYKLAIIDDSRVRIRITKNKMQKARYPLADPTFDQIQRFATCTVSSLVRLVLHKASPALSEGDRVTVVGRPYKGSVGTIVAISDPNTGMPNHTQARILPPAVAEDSDALDHTFVGLLKDLRRHGLDLYYTFKVHDRVRVVSGPLYVGAIGRVTRCDGDFIGVAMAHDCEVVGATDNNPISKEFVVPIEHAVRQWAPGDCMRVTRGDYANRIGLVLDISIGGCLHIYEVDPPELKLPDDFDHNTLYEIDPRPHGDPYFKVRSSDVDFEPGRWTDMNAFGLFPHRLDAMPASVISHPEDPSRLPSVDIARRERGFKDIEVIIARTAHSKKSLGVPPAVLESGHGMTRGCRTEGFSDVPHKGFIGTIIGDYDSLERRERLEREAREEPVLMFKFNRGGYLLKPRDKTRLRGDADGIMLTIRHVLTMQTIQAPIENAVHLGTMQPLLQARHLPYAIVYSTTTREERIPNGPFPPLPPPPRAITPCGPPTAAPLWTSAPQLEGEHNSLWICGPSFVGKRLDVQVVGIATLKNKRLSPMMRGLEGRFGWVLLSTAVDPKDKRVDVCSMGKNGTLHAVDKRCVKPRRENDDGKSLLGVPERVVIIGPDANADSTRKGEYALTVPSLDHSFPKHVVGVKFVDGSHGFFTESSLCLAQNVQITYGSHTYLTTTFP